MPNDLTTAEPIIRPACFPGVLVRLLFPLAAVGMAFLAQSKGWGPFNLVLPPRWAAIPAAVPSAGRQEKLAHDRVGRNVLRLGQPQTIALWPRQVCGSSRAATTFFVSSTSPAISKSGHSCVMPKRTITTSLDGTTRTRVPIRRRNR
ncbi:MAG: hypothetical protein QOF70_5004 [Acetobacteraceae bacterium]|jgi:hypothetical protein|nr:hypothetical protein [Acetobacteraceae bacterium]